MNDPQLQLGVELLLLQWCIVWLPSSCPSLAAWVQTALAPLLEPTM